MNSYVSFQLVEIFILLSLKVKQWNFRTNIKISWNKFDIFFLIIFDVRSAFERGCSFERRITNTTVKLNLELTGRWTDTAKGWIAWVRQSKVDANREQQYFFDGETTVGQSDCYSWRFTAPLFDAGTFFWKKITYALARASRPDKSHLLCVIIVVLRAAVVRE